MTSHDTGFCLQGIETSPPRDDTSSGFYLNTCYFVDSRWGGSTVTSELSLPYARYSYILPHHFGHRAQFTRSSGPKLISLNPHENHRRHPQHLGLVFLLYRPMPSYRALISYCSVCPSKVLLGMRQPVSVIVPPE